MIEILYWYALVGVSVFVVGHWLDVLYTFKPIWNPINFQTFFVCVVAWPVLLYTVWRDDERRE